MRCLLTAALIALVILGASPGRAGEAVRPGEDLSAYLADRGTGTPTSMFGTYVRGGEILVYPFFEYYYDQDSEYAPEEFGYTGADDYEGHYRASEGLIFLGYGLTEDIAFELEAAVIRATQKRCSDDTSNMPEEVTESGLGDVQTQIDWRWLGETSGHPELFSYLEVVYPLQKDKKLIGTKDWEFKLGTGVIRGFGWGTLTARAAVEYSRESEETDLGEVALEYLKRLSSSWGVYLGVEAAQDEVELITELRWHVADFALIKLNNAFGLTPKATDWAPEVGVMFSL